MGIRSNEVSLKRAFTVIQSIDYNKFDVYPIYITREGRWCSQGKLDGMPVVGKAALPKKVPLH
ncbi:hypothetical protein [Paenibacillus baekrokdamisoli]|uniref:hypothetical protein n=1 Tax=Paenibacillus baekrokdamisoli TaxID=1712516 RepID=UPI001C848BFE|nr:hypothetical protein [Paenibacillus baekrokdamisoli]